MLDSLKKKFRMNTKVRVYKFLKNFEDFYEEQKKIFH